jgi:putative transcriptional regulator
MSIHHHPADDTLLRFAAGTLTPGLALVARAHLDVCAQCRARVVTFEAMGGALLEAEADATMAPEAFANVLARLDEAPPAAAARPRARHAKLNLPPDVALPRRLADCDIGPWLWFGRGIRYSQVRLPWAPEANVMLLRVAANRAVVHHTHSAHELTLILRGGYSDCMGQYGPGDMAEGDTGVLHRPKADDEGCLCLAALEGTMRLNGWLGVLQRRLGLY